MFWVVSTNVKVCITLPYMYPNAPCVWHIQQIPAWSLMEALLVHFYMYPQHL